MKILVLGHTGMLGNAVYKHLSGYYKNLRKKRGLVKQYSVAINIIEFYGVVFFINKFNLSEEKVYEFVLGALENSNIESDFRTSDHGLVLESFEKFHQSINEEN